MRVFLTGGTGVLGRSVVRLLSESGHQVRALSRSSENAELLRKLVAEPVDADLFDNTSLRQAIRGTDAILHLATKIPPSWKFRFNSAWTTNDRIRRNGTRNLVNAALALGTSVFIYPSVCFVYPDSGASWIEGQTTRAVPHPMTVTTLDAEAAVSRMTAQGRRGISLRMGGFYGPCSVQTREQLNHARRGLATIFGEENTYHSSIWIQDAASAVVAALHRAPSGTYDIVDDEPLDGRETAAALASAVDRRKLLQIPMTILRLSMGTRTISLLSRSLRISNRRFRQTTGWFPKVPSARIGWKLVAEHLGCYKSGIKESPIGGASISKEGINNGNCASD